MGWVWRGNGEGERGEEEEGEEREEHDFLGAVSGVV